MSSFANCSNFSETQLTILTGLRGGVSVALSLASVILVIVTCACQSKLKFGRRDRSFKITLFALFGVSTCYLTVLSLGVVYHLIRNPSSARKWCAAFGYFDQILGVTQTTLLFINTNPIVALLLSEITRGRNLEERRKNCIVWGIMSLIIVLAAMILISSFVPFVNETYGEVCVWCWIIYVDKECKVGFAGFLERMLLFGVYQAFISLLCIVMILTSVILFLKACVYKIRIRRNRTLNERHDYKHLFSKYIFQLVILIPVLCEYAVLVAELHTHRYSFLLWVYYAIAPPISGFLIPLSFLFYLKFSYAESRDSSPHVTNNKERVHNTTVHELRSPSINVTAFTSESNDDYHTCLDQTLVTWATNYKNRSVQAESQHLLENHCESCYSS